MLRFSEYKKMRTRITFAVFMTKNTNSSESKSYFLLFLPCNYRIRSITKHTCCIVTNHARIATLFFVSCFNQLSFSEKNIANHIHIVDIIETLVYVHKFIQSFLFVC